MSERIRRADAVKRQLVDSGLSTRARGVLEAAAEHFGGIEPIRAARWDDDGDEAGLRRQLLRFPGCGDKVIAEIEAWREGRDPRTAIVPGPITVATPFQPEVIAALDAWIAKQPKPVSRQEAIRAFVAAGLHMMGGAE